MTDENAFGAFEFVFDPTLDGSAGYDEDDLAQDTPGPFLPNTEGRSEFLPPDPDRMPVIENAVDRDSVEYAARPAIDRTRELFGQMHAQRPMLKKIIESAKSPITTAQAEEAIKGLRDSHFILYSTANLCSMLEQAGALKCVDEQGNAYVRASREPNIVVIDGEEYYEPSTPPAICWVATEAGTAVAAEKDPVQRTEQLFEKEEKFLPIHKRVLEMCNEGDGASVPNMSAAIDDNPLIADPRRFFVQHFIEGLENAGAVAWSGKKWVTTDVGKEALAKLADVKYDYKPEAAADGFTVATETDGVRW